MIFNSETQRPSAVNEWQIPQREALPIPLFLLLREVPLEAHEMSYFADSAKISSFEIIFS